MGTKRIKDKDYTVVPNLHFVIIAGCFVVLAVVLGVYAFVPAGDKPFLQSVIWAVLMFITGKASNGFGRPIKPLPMALPAEEDADGDGVRDSEQR